MKGSLMEGWVMMDSLPQHTFYLSISSAGNQESNEYIRLLYAKVLCKNLTNGQSQLVVDKSQGNSKWAGRSNST